MNKFHCFSLNIVMILFSELSASTPDLTSTITFTGEQVICNEPGTTITAFAEGALTYTWNNGVAGPVNYITTSGLYSVSVTFANGNAASRNIKILHSKDIPLPVSDMCLNFSAQLIPIYNEGYWTSNKPQVATITSSGMITAVKPGLASFTFHFNQSNCTIDSKEITINPLPTLLAVKNEICPEQEVQLYPNTGGTWNSETPEIATINNAGLARSLTAGTPHFTFTSNSTGCINSLKSVIVHPKPIVEIEGKDTICWAYTTRLKPSSGGSWSNTEMSHYFATINNAGIVTGLQEGRASFIFHHSTTGCVSGPSPYIYVVNPPKITTTLPKELCLGGHRQRIVTEKEGTWSILNPALASINNKGFIYPLSPGKAILVHNSPYYACPSELIEFNIHPVTTSVSSTNINQNSFIDLSSNAPGTWNSLNPEIIRVSGNTKAISYDHGQTELHFYSESGCFSGYFIDVARSKTGPNTGVNIGFSGNGTNPLFGNGLFGSNLNKDMLSPEHLDVNNIAIFPNPTTDILKIKSSNFQTIQIRNVSGTVLWESDGNVQEVNIQHWLPGVYTVLFVSQHQQVTKKFVKI